MTDYYVSPFGSSSGGTSSSSPADALERVLSRLKPGDTVHVMAGAYSPLGSQWAINGINGTAAQPITIQAYSGHSPVFTGSRAKPYTGWPTVTAAEYAAAPKAYYDKAGEYASIKSKNLVIIQNCSYLVWDGIDVKDSLSRNLTIYNSEYITVKNCTIGPANNINLLVEACENITIQDCTVTASGSWWPAIRSASYLYDWQAALAVKGTDTITVDGLLSYGNWGEAFIADANTGGASNVTVKDSTFHGNMKEFFLQAVDTVVVERCLFYDTAADVASGIMQSSASALAILSEESPTNNPNDRIAATDITIRNCAFLRCEKGGLQVRGGPRRKTLTDVKIYNNTFSYCGGQALDMAVANKSGVVIKNNIFNAASSSDLVNMAVSMTGITADYNVWSHDISGDEDIADGANDAYGDPGLVDEDYRPIAADRAGSVSSFRLTSGSNARGAAEDLSASFTDDHYGQTRSAWDIGAHEYDGNAALTATAAATNSPQPEGTAITFTATAGGGTSTYTYGWDFGDGSTSTSQNPSHAYASAGTYTATLTITDSSTPVQTAVDTVDVVITGTSAGTVAPVTVKQVAFNVGDASFNPTITPKAIIFVWSNGVSNGTIADHAGLGYGIWASDGQYAVYSRDGDALATSDSVSKSTNTSAILAMSNTTDAERFRGTVGAVSSSSVALSWSGTTSTAERVIAYVIGGTGVSNVTATDVSLSWDGTTDSVSGDYTFLFAPSTGIGAAFDSAVGQHRISAGFAARDGGMGCVAVLSRDNQASADVRGVARNDAIAAWPLSAGNAYVSVESWDSSGITLKQNALSDTAGLIQPLLLMKLSSEAQAYVGVVDMPASTGNNDYSVGMAPQIGWIVASTLTETNAVSSDTAAGQITWASVDSSDVDYSMSVSAKDAVSPTVAKSVTDADFTQLGSAGTMVNEGALTNEAAAVRVNLTTAAGTAYKALLVAIESTSTGDNPTAAFSVEAGPYYYDTAITFTDLSVSDGTHTTLTYDIDWGDGSTHGADADMSGGGTGTGETIQHTYDEAGTYTVTWTVTDNNSDVGTATATLEVRPPAPTFDLAVDPTTGDIPLSIEFDASGSTAGGDETIDTERSYIEVVTAAAGDVPAQRINGLTGTLGFNDVAQLTATVVLYHSGWSYRYEQTFNSVATPGTTRSVYISTPGGAGPFTAYGPVDIDFALTSSQSLDGATITWDFTDNDADPDLASAETTNTYAAQTSATTYDVEVTVDWPDGTQTVETLTDWVTIVPRPTPPVNIQKLYANLNQIKAHLGILAGKTWTRLASPNTSVFYTELDNHEWADGMTVRVWEDGALLTAQASIAAAQAAAGSSYYTYSSGTLTVYVHPTTSDNPNLNGKNYRWLD